MSQPIRTSGETLHEGDVLAVSSKYTAISEGRIAERYSINLSIVQLVIQEADHVFGGIPGFLLTFEDGILSPNAGIDRSNIPNGNAVLFPEHPYRSEEKLRAAPSLASTSA